MRTAARFALFLSLASILLGGGGGCALQSSLVDLEQEIKATRETQSELTRLGEELKEMIRAARNIPPDNAEGRALVAGKLNLLEEQVRRLEGRLEEDGHKTTEAVQKMDDQAHQVNTLMARLDLLEKQIAVMKTVSPAGAAPLEGAQGGKNHEAGIRDSAFDPASTPAAPAPPPAVSPSPPAPPAGALAPLGSASLISPQEAYRLAYNDYLRGNYDLAIMNFKNYVAQYPHSAFLPEAIYWIGQSYYSQGIYPEAVAFFKQLEERYPAHELVPNALLKTALAFAALSDSFSARTALEKVIERFPQSEAAMRAKGELSVLNSHP